MDLTDLTNLNNKFGFDKNNPYIFCEEGINPSREREIEVLLSLGNGYLGIRNSLEELYKISDPGCFIAGIYETNAGETINRLVKVPNWSKIQVFVDDNLLDIFEENTLEHRRYIDVKQGIAVREWRVEDQAGRITSIKTIKYASFSNKHEAGKSIIIVPENYSGKIKVKTGIDASFIDKKVAFPVTESVPNRLISLSMRTRNTNELVSITQKSEIIIKGNGSLETSINANYIQSCQQDFSFEEWEWNAELGDSYSVNSLIAIYTSLDTNTPVEDSLNHLNTEQNNFSNSLNLHIERWKERFAESEIIIDNDEAQQAINFAIYHLLISGEFSGIKYSVPARNLMGEAYQGHVFWDTEIFLLPFYVFTKPEIAKNLLLYRYNTLQCARKNAEAQGHKGASYAWESTDTGLEMTPVSAKLPTGEIIPILSGLYEKHISADIAYAVWQYWIATEDEEFLCEYGAEILFECARYNASLISYGQDGLYHINKVIGPDEYHDLVDDNDYTNFLVKFNLVISLKTIELLESKYTSKLEELKSKLNIDDSEIKIWNELKDKIHINIDHKSGIYEQFKGYFDLEYIDLKSYEPRTAPMDIILGREKTNNSQVVKQPDVLMFMFLLANWFDIKTVKENYEYYEPRTGHGSSLSPGIHSLIAARSGIINDAVKYFKQNSRIDLNNNSGNAALGIHIASLGCGWMSVAFGFAGIYIHENGLAFNPVIPEEWKKIKLNFLWKSQKLSAEIFPEELILINKGQKNVYVSAGFHNWIELEPEKIYSAHKKGKLWIWN